MEHDFAWGPFDIHLSRGSYRLRLHGTVVGDVEVSDVDGAPLPLGLCLAAALARVRELAEVWGAEVPRRLPARAHAIARWF